MARNYDGMMVGLPPGEWLCFRDLEPTDMAACLRQWAAQVCLEKVRKAPAKPRHKAKQAKPKPPFDPNKPHISTARLLAARRKKE